MKRGAQWIGVVSLIGVLGGAFVACGKDDPATETPSGVGEYRGVLATDTGLAVVSVTVRDAAATAKGLATKAAVEVSGTFTFDDSSITVTGTSDGRAVSLSGGGYTLAGTIADGVLTVTVTRGSLSRSTTLFAGGASIQLYCGRYNGSKNGPIGVAVAGARAAGAVVVAGSGAALTGTTSGASFQLTGFPPSGKVDGTVAGAAMSGTWNDGAGGSGAFDGTNDKCPRGTATDAGTDTSTDTGTDTGATDTGATDTGATDTGTDTGAPDSGGSDGGDAGGACSSLVPSGLPVTEGTFAGSDDTTYAGGTVLEGTYTLNARKRTPFESAPAGVLKMTMRFTKKPAGGAQDFLYERVVSDNGTITSESGEITFGVPPFTGGSVGTNGYRKKVACPATVTDNAIQYSVPDAGTLWLKWFRAAPSSEIYAGWEEYKKI